eukprot:CAMPEP_0185560798 /NCGR_PEP_ID=MMETSP1381-20130426/57737_1 /TAXON_ID=298111 /ORGANISM="Pavlova sp., Strain CCMP459" /LENGTH=53 /DNA_ID=CAMNT_0028174533 /DNA_START=95 /DNA_END=253 /DNA_ORIENTATION=-
MARRLRRGFFTPGSVEVGGGDLARARVLEPWDWAVLSWVSGPWGWAALARLVP